MSQKFSEMKNLLHITVDLDTSYYLSGIVSTLYLDRTGIDPIPNYLDEDMSYTT